LIYLTVFILAILLGIAGLTWENARVAHSGQGGIDFFPQWAAANAWSGSAKGISPYAAQVAQQIYRDVQGHEPIPAIKAAPYAFLSPLYSMAFLAPLGAMDIVTARTIWMAVSELCLILIAVFTLKLSGWKVTGFGAGFLFLFALISYYGARTVIQGSFSAVGAALILGGLLLIQTRHDMDAGLVLALATVDLHLSALLVLFTVIWALSVGRLRIVAGILIGVGFLTVCAMVFIPDWPIQWVKSMFLNLPAIVDRGSVIETLANRMPGISHPLSLVLYGLAGIYLVWEWILAWGRDERWFLWTALLTLVISLVLPLRVASTDAVVLLPVVCMLFRSWQERWGVGGQRAAWVLLGLFTAGFWELFLVTLNGTRESPIMQLLPPILCLICLWWVRWWATHHQRLFFEEYPV
jgi:hypothetical protein